MTEQTSVVNIHGDHEETLLQLAKHLGTSRIRRAIFNTIYGRGSRPRSKKQIMEAAKIPTTGTYPQQVQNELDHLAKHHLVVRIENAGQIKDGSRFLYQKEKTVRANKERLLRLADNRRLADRVPTKRKPFIRNPIAMRPPTKTLLRKRRHLTVLYLVANPEPKAPLRIDAEIRKVQEAIRGSVYRDNISIEYRPAADLHTLIDGLNDHRPQIVHFSGHGEPGALAMDTGSVSGNATSRMSFDLLDKALSATDKPPQVIVLNSCNSATAKKALLPSNRIVIGMRAPVSDVAAAAFARRFYAAIASGQSVKAAFEQGKVAVEAVSLNESDTPELIHDKSINPARLVLT